MPALPISAMTPATSVLNADLLALVSAGANYNVTRPVYLSAIAGDAIALQSANSKIEIAGDDSINVNVPNAKGVLITGPVDAYFQVIMNAGALLTVQDGFVDLAVGSTFLNMSLLAGFDLEAAATLPFFVGSNDGTAMYYDGSTTLNITTNTGVNLHLATQSAAIDIFDSGNISIVTGTGLDPLIVYNTAVSADWNGTPPSTLYDALNRLAAWVALKVGPIP